MPIPTWLLPISVVCICSSSYFPRSHIPTTGHMSRMSTDVRRSWWDQYSANSAIASAMRANLLLFSAPLSFRLPPSAQMSRTSAGTRGTRRNLTEAIFRPSRPGCFHLDKFHPSRIIIPHPISLLRPNIAHGRPQKHIGDDGINIRPTLPGFAYLCRIPLVFS